MILVCIVCVFLFSNIPRVILNFDEFLKVEKNAKWVIDTGSETLPPKVLPFSGRTWKVIVQALQPGSSVCPASTTSASSSTPPPTSSSTTSEATPSKRPLSNMSKTFHGNNLSSSSASSTCCFSVLEAVQLIQVREPRKGNWRRVNILKWSNCRPLMTLLMWRPYNSIITEC